MPVNSRMNKTRTSKNKRKAAKLKWWYVLPVIVIVAVAGYLVIRYSQAGVSDNKTVGNGLFGGRGVINTKSNIAKGYPSKALKIDGSPVGARVGLPLKPGSRDFIAPLQLISAFKGSRNSPIYGKYICALVWTGNTSDANRKWSMNVKGYSDFGRDTVKVTWGPGILKIPGIGRLASKAQNAVNSIVSQKVNISNIPVLPAREYVLTDNTSVYNGVNGWRTGCMKANKGTLKYALIDTEDIPKAVDLKYDRPVYARVTVFNGTPGNNKKLPEVAVGRIWVSNTDQTGK